MTRISIESLTAGYTGHPVVRNVTLDVSPGEVLAIVGHNGAGKSTLLRALLGTAPEVTGRIALDGRDLSGTSIASRVAAGFHFVPQHDPLFPDLTVDDNLRVLVTRHGWTHDSTTTRIASLMPEIQSMFAVLARKLSAGQQRAIAVAAGITRQPRVLMLDEPTASLPDALVERTLTWISRLAEREGSAVLVVEHRIEEVLGHAHRVLGIRDGSPVVLATPADAGGLRGVLTALLD